MEKGFRALVDSEGNLKIFDIANFKKFLATQKSKDVVVLIQINEGTGSEKTYYYFMNVICVEFIKIFKEHFNEVTTKEVVSQRLRSWCPVCRDGDELRELSDLSQEHFSELIRNSKHIASKEFDYFISE